MKQEDHLIYANPCFEEQADLIFFDSYCFQDNISLIPYLPVLSSRFKKIVLYTNDFMYQFWLKVCEHFKFLQIVPISSFTPDLDRQGIVINLDKFASIREQINHSYLLIQLYFPSSLQITDDSDDTENASERVDSVMRSFCRYFDLNLNKLEPSLAFQLINHYYPAEVKTNEILALVHHPLKLKLLNKSAKKKNMRLISLIPHPQQKCKKCLYVRFLMATGKYKPLLIQEYHDFDAQLMLIKQSATFITDDSDYFKFFSYGILDINTKKIGWII